MATGSIMPLLAQSFVETRSGVDLEQADGTSGPVLGQMPLTKQRSRDVLRSMLRRSSGDSPSESTKDIFSWSDDELAAHYRFSHELNYGNWGSVWLCQRKENGVPQEDVAVKLVHRSKSPASASRVRALWTELKAVRSMNGRKHPNVIDFHSFVITPSYALIVMDYHPSLIQVAVPESKARLYFRQLVSAVDYLHANGCTHNDIKPANILISPDDAPVLADFGFARLHKREESDRFLSWTSWGTPEYLAPERARGLHHDERLSDIWALGVTMYEVVVGRTPFEENESEEFLDKAALEIYYQRATTGKFFGQYDISSDFGDLINKMVDPEASTRLRPCGSALQHVFFNPAFPPLPGQQPKRPLDKRKSAHMRAVLHSPPTSVKSVPHDRFDDLRTPTKHPQTTDTSKTEPKPVNRKKVIPRKPVKIYEDVQSAEVNAVASAAVDWKTKVLGDMTNVLHDAKGTQKPHSRIPLRKYKRADHEPVSLRNALSPTVPKTDPMPMFKQTSAQVISEIKSRSVKEEQTDRKPDAASSHEKVNDWLQASDAQGASLPTESRCAPKTVSKEQVEISSPVESTSSMVTAPSVQEEKHRPGHRRVPTAIRTVPSIMLTESGDEGATTVSTDLTTSSVCSTPASEQAFVFCPTTRLVEEGRQLPTWIPEDDESDGGVDEPTITIADTAALHRASKKAQKPPEDRRTSMNQRMLKHKDSFARLLLRASTTSLRSRPTTPTTASTSSRTDQLDNRHELGVMGTSVDLSNEAVVATTEKKGQGRLRRILSKIL